MTKRLSLYVAVGVCVLPVTLPYLQVSNLQYQGRVVLRNPGSVYCLLIVYRSNGPRYLVSGY